MKVISFLIELIFQIVLITGILGGNYYLYKNYFHKENNLIQKKKLIMVNVNKLYEIEKNILIKKYKKDVLALLNNKNLLKLTPDKLLNKEIKSKINQDLIKFRAKLNTILEQLTNKGYIIFTDNTVIKGIPDATQDIEYLLKIKNGGINVQ